MHHLHYTIVNLSQIVVLDGTSGALCSAVDDGGSAKIRTKFVCVKACAHEWTALAEKFLQIFE